MKGVTSLEIVSVLPGQGELNEPSHRFPPEKALMLAILQDAIHIFLNHRDAVKHKQAQQWGEAHKWIESRNANGLYSFVTICRYLGLDPDWLRAGVFLHGLVFTRQRRSVGHRTTVQQTKRHMRQSR